MFKPSINPEGLNIISYVTYIIIIFLLVALICFLVLGCTLLQVERKGYQGYE